MKCCIEGKMKPRGLKPWSWQGDSAVSAGNSANILELATCTTCGKNSLIPVESAETRPIKCEGAVDVSNERITSVEPIPEFRFKSGDTPRNDIWVIGNGRYYKIMLVKPHFRPEDVIEGYCLGSVRHAPTVKQVWPAGQYIPKGVAQK